MDFLRYAVTPSIVIEKLITCYYFELAKNYLYHGEKHDFWELFYVDKGEILIDTDCGHYHLKQGDLLFHEPNEFHNAKSNGKIAPNVFVITFECAQPAIQFFQTTKLFHVSDMQRTLLKHIMQESVNAFGPGPKGSKARLHPRVNAPFGSEQLFVNYLEILLIQLIREGYDHTDIKPVVPPAPASADHPQASMLEQVMSYIERHVAQNPTLEQLCGQFGVGRTQLSILFKSGVGCGVIEYLNKVKIDKAKTFIREEEYNLTEIAELLGYSSVHYFSRHFKKTTGMTPSEYGKMLSRGFSRNIPR